ncbi:MAG: glycosyltransferase [Clostridia bacterium]|nr:glycosyltransferase [Clostridia bacterium]
MKVLQVNCVYDSGSTGKITADLHREYQKNGIDSIVCYGRLGKTADKGVYKVCGEYYSKLNHFRALVTGIPYGGCLFSTNKLISIIKKEKPDLVHLQCINGYFVNIYRLVTWLKQNNVKTVLTLHAEFMFTGSCGYSYSCEKFKTGCGNCPQIKNGVPTYLFDNTARSFKKMKKAFDGFDQNLIVTSVSPWLMERAKSSVILGNKKHFVVENGLDETIFRPSYEEALRNKYAKENEKIIFYATPYFSADENNAKGGKNLIELAERFKGEKVTFLIAGDYDKDVVIPDNIILLGRISNQKDLAKLYSIADVTVITSRRETFSMICAESLCCGTPVCGFFAGGPETIALTEYTEFVEYGNIEALYEAVKNNFDKKTDMVDIISKTATKRYKRENMYRAMLHVYDGLLNGDK